MKITFLLTRRVPDVPSPVVHRVQQLLTEAGHEVTGWIPEDRLLRTDTVPERTPMAKKSDVRPIVKLRSTEGTGYTYVTTKNRRNTPDRLVMKKYDPILRRVVDFREER